MKKLDCSHCGKDNSANAQFCVHCGTKLESKLGWGSAILASSITTIVLYTAILNQLTDNPLSKWTALVGLWAATTLGLYYYFQRKC